MTWNFGDGRWVKGGTLDNTFTNLTLGYLYLAQIGTVEMRLTGDMSGGLCGRRLQFQNHSFHASYLHLRQDRTRVNAKDGLEYFRKSQRGTVANIRLDDILRVEWCSQENGFCEIQLPVITGYFVA